MCLLTPKFGMEYEEKEKEESVESFGKKGFGEDFNLFSILSR